MEYVYSENFEYQKSHFYISQIERLIELSSTNGKVEAWAPPIVSFFSGTIVESNNEVQPKHSAIHIFALEYAEDKEILRTYFVENYRNIIQWVSSLYFYFRTVNGYPHLANELLEVNGLLSILDILENLVSFNIDKIKFYFLRAYSQILSYSIGKNMTNITERCLNKINKEYLNIEENERIELMLYRCVNSNRNNKNYYSSLFF